MNANEPMTDERLARLAADNEPVGDHLSGLTADEVAELVAEVTRLRADNGALIESGRKWMRAANADHERVVAVEAELSMMRNRLGREQIQWGVRYTAGVDGTGADCSEEEDPVDYCDDQADATKLAAYTPGAIPVWHLRGDWHEVASDA